MKNQILATATVNLLPLVYGITVGWMAPNIVLFQTEASPVGVLNAEQISLTASLLAAGGCIGTFLFGAFANYWGRKPVLIALAVPQLVCMTLIAVGSNYIYIYVARLLSGIAAGGIYIIIPIFVNEIASDKIRGALGTILSVMVNVGIVLGFILSTVLDYYTIPYVVMTFVVLFIVLFVWFPDSPEYLRYSKRYEAAEASQKFYAVVSVNSSSTPPHTNGVEMGKRTLSGSEVTAAAEEEQRLSWSDLKDRGIQRGAFLGLMLIFFADTCGLYPLLNFMTDIFKRADIEMDIYHQTIIVGVVQIIGTCVSTVFIDRFGRRALLMFSALGGGIFIAMLAVYFYLLKFPEYHHVVLQLQWLPVLSLGGFFLIAPLGITTLPFFIVAELLPVKVRGPIVGITLGVSWILAFALLQFFQDFIGAFGLDGTLALFAASCAVEIGFVYVCLPETKNLSFDEIQIRLGGKK